MLEIDKYKQINEPINASGSDENEDKRGNLSDFHRD